MKSSLFQKLAGLMKRRDLHFKTHTQEDEISVLEDGRWVCWCKTHQRYEPVSFL